MAAYARMSEKIKKGEYDDAAGTKLTGVLRLFNEIDAHMESRGLSAGQRDTLWQEYFGRQTARIMRFRTRQPGT
jgi:hypothetical protein